MVKNFNTNPDCSCCKDKSCAALALNEVELNLLSAGCTEEKRSKGEIILPQGSRTSHIIYLKSGIAKEYQQLGNNQEYILQIVKNHTYLGLSSLFGDNFNHLSYTALSDVTICFIEREVIKSLLMNNSKFSYLILETVCKDSLNSYHRFANQHQKHVHGKLADALLYMARQIFDAEEFEIPLNRLEISFLIGTSRESVSKQLRIYEREGILELKGKKIRILNFEQLDKISRFG